MSDVRGFDDRLFDARQLDLRMFDVQVVVCVCVWCSICRPSMSRFLMLQSTLMFSSCSFQMFGFQLCILLNIRRSMLRSAILQISSVRCLSRRRFINQLFSLYPPGGFKSEDQLGGSGVCFSVLPMLVRSMFDLQVSDVSIVEA